MYVIKCRVCEALMVDEADTQEEGRGGGGKGGVR